MKLSENNYYSQQANEKYCSVSQFKNFFGTYAKEGCERRALAEIKGEYEREMTDALLVGQYVDTALTDSSNLEKFINEHPEMFSTRGSTKGLLKSQFNKANQMIERAKNDKVFMKYLDGEHQVIMTGNIFGLPFKIKMDNYIPHKAIVDLKTCESIGKSYYTADGRMNFVNYFDYILQGAIYQEIVFQNTGERLPFYLACISKESITDLEIIYIDNETFHTRLHGNEFVQGIASECENIRLLKAGEIEPQSCGHCDYCLPKKKILKPIHYLEIGGTINDL